MEECEHEWVIVDKLRKGKVFSMVTWCKKCSEIKSKSILIKLKEKNGLGF